MGLAPTSGLREFSGHNAGVDRLPGEMNDMRIRDDKEMEAAIIDGNGTETSYIILKTIAGRNGQPKQEFFTEYGEANQYEIQEVVGKRSYGVVAAAVDTHTGKKVAIRKINNVLEHVSESTRILREIKLLYLLRHADIVEVKQILLSPCPREFKDIYVVFELMECDLQYLIKANDSLTPEHYQFFLYQLLRDIVSTANVFHRYLKPKNILANTDYKIKICDFRLAWAAFGNTPSAIF
ncbi:Mitogen-activated protein kinase 8 [Capsicum annuum]|uniref:Mitogen-activated protein kinase 8 n=1 Tax=Capsicum annuum TaxID=4072 RepID=A0A2G2YGP4_CAPAN|nr:Mitogen-activated protein kinase 8 [Capsicum annuum]